MNQRKVLLVILVILAVLAWFFVIYEIRKHALTQNFRHRSQFRQLLMKKPASSSDINSIQSWMTFDYINTIFHLPPSVLQQDLSITDTHYPHVSLSHVAAEEHISSTNFTNQVKNSVRSYIASSTTPAS